MKAIDVDPARIRGAWAGRISGCQLGKPVEILSMRSGREALTDYLRKADALPLRDYVPALPDSFVERVGLASCRGHLVRSEPDDDINYSVLALLLLEQHGAALDTADVARAWLRYLPAGMTFTAERAAYRILLDRMSEGFVFGAEPGFDLAECAQNDYDDWIGAQIRADVYGWVLPGQPERAAELARRDASLSHRGDGVHGAAFVAALGAAIPAADSLEQALDVARRELPDDSRCAAAVDLARSLVGAPDPVGRLYAAYGELSPVHTVNNLALVVWALANGAEDFSAAIGEAVAAGWDTDCNGATVGALWGLTGRALPAHWTEPWSGRVAVTLAGLSELSLDELVARTVALARSLRS
jgi:ADP-ribosylglycohydrolase